MARSYSSLALVLAALGAATGCNRASAAAEPAKAETKAAAAKAEPQAAPQPAAASSKYAVPFTWETSPNEPLAVTRGFLGEVLRDNRLHAAQGSKLFLRYRDEQKPRATAVTCADSRVHATAFDASPENDVFFVRNLGNQVKNAEGSVEYGVEHLQTPVLLVIGHTGCGAVKAALGDLGQQSKAVRAELEPLALPRPEPGKDENTAWSDAVIANVHAQVGFGVRRFGDRVQQGKLTVIGAVYDFRNDLGNGAGRLSIVDVNGDGDPERMKAFVSAVAGGIGRLPQSAAPATAAAGNTSSFSTGELARALEQLESRPSARHTR